MYSIITYKHITLLTLSDGHIMPVAVMMAPAVGGMGGCKPVRETVGGGLVAVI